MDLYHNKKIIVKNIEIADSYKKRLIGLLKAKSSDDCFIYIPDCNLIHTFFMKFIIDAVMIDRDKKVIYIKENLKPFKVAGCLKAKDTVELEKGSIKKYNIKIGDILELK